jgi:UDP-3-O-[3-hydroxymyristoyl] glucosamine N-acyltransferase
MAVAVTFRQIRLDEIARAVDGHVVGSPDVAVSGVSSLGEAGPTDLGYVASDRFIRAATESKAVAFVVGREISDLSRPQILVKNPAYAFARIAEIFFVSPFEPRGVSEHIARGQGV